jgi:ribosomal protein S18 acetylase RimI-like enzyme
MGRRRTTEARTFQIRPATETDLPSVLGCLRESFEPYRADYTPAAFADTVPSEQALRERFRRMTILVAEDPSGAIVGTIACAPASVAEGHLRGMAVRGDWQGSGVAGALLDGALERLRSLGCQRATLDTTQPLERAVRFYEKNGFRRTGKVTDFFGMPLFEFARELT